MRVTPNVQITKLYFRATALTFNGWVTLVLLLLLLFLLLLLLLGVVLLLQSIGVQL